MAKFTRIIGGVLRSFDETGGTPTYPPIYDQRYNVGSTITTGTPITLPNSGTYTVSSGVTSLNVYLNNTRLEYGIDFTTAGAGPSYTQIAVTFDLFAPDTLDFRSERNTT